MQGFTDRQIVETMAQGVQRRWPFLREDLGQFLRLQRKEQEKGCLVTLRALVEKREV